MTTRLRLVGAIAVIGLFLTPDLLACGEKFLMSGRGTRYQRPKNARAATVLIYANPASGLTAALKKVPLEAVLKHEGHRSTTVETPAQLSSILAGGRFDVVVAASNSVDAVQQLLGAGLDAPVVVALCVNSPGQEPAGTAKNAKCVKMPPKEGSILEAVDKAVEVRDKNVRRMRASS